ncbi:MAG: CD225/dispanin family protein [Muribaculum sp.]|nr:CD225/dispanin family protein [Muribaculaceae bacterium]MCM1080292.1 CD225/dispanin family protein [Muribaculum sp.]
MEYWAIIDNQQVGPYSPAQIAAMGLTPDTLVWRNGMSRWEKARYISDFAQFFPPEFAPGTTQWQNNDMPDPPSNYLIWSIISFLLCCQLTGAIALVYSVLVEYRYSHGNYAGAQSASSIAKTWNIISIVLALVSIPVMLFTGLFTGLLGLIL